MADYERTHYESDSGDSDESYEGIPPSGHAFGIQGYQFEPRRDPSNIYASSDSSDSEDIEEEEGDETSTTFEPDFVVVQVHEVRLEITDDIQGVSVLFGVHGSFEQGFADWITRRKYVR